MSKPFPFPAWWRALVGLLLAALLAPALAAPLVLDGSTSRVDAWPAVTVLHDPTNALTVEQVLAQPAGFAPPASAYATLGVSRQASWLKVARGALERPLFRSKPSTRWRRI